MRRVPEFSRFNQLVQVEEIRWMEAEHWHDIYRTDETRLAFQKASVRFDRLSEAHSLVIDTAAISYVAFHICTSGIRPTSLAVSLLINSPGARGKPNLAQIGRVLGISRQAISVHSRSAAEVFGQVEGIVQGAIRLQQPSGPRDHERVQLQRRAMVGALTTVARHARRRDRSLGRARFP